MGEAAAQVAVGGVEGVGAVLLGVGGWDEGLLELLGAVAAEAHWELLSGEVELEWGSELVQVEELLAAFLLHFLHRPPHIAQHLFLGTLLDLRLTRIKRLMLGPTEPHFAPLPGHVLLLP